MERAIRRLTASREFDGIYASEDGQVILGVKYGGYMNRDMIEVFGSNGELLRSTVAIGKLMEFDVEEFKIYTDESNYRLWMRIEMEDGMAYDFLGDGNIYDYSFRKFEQYIGRKSREKSHVVVNIRKGAVTEVMLCEIDPLKTGDLSANSLTSIEVPNDMWETENHYVEEIKYCFKRGVGFCCRYKGKMYYDGSKSRDDSIVARMVEKGLVDIGEWDVELEGLDSWIMIPIHEYTKGIIKRKFNKVV
jgi:hypothetical protein